MKTLRPTRSSAFTLLEIMLAVAIIALVLAAAVVGYQGAFGFAKDTVVKSDINTISNGMRLYEMMNGYPPSTDQGIKALNSRPTTSPEPKQWRVLLEKIPVDPWGHEYVYVRPGKHNPDGYDLYSLGADGQPDTADDIGNWETTPPGQGPAN